LAKGYSVYTAATIASVNRSTVYRWRDEDPDFKDRWDEAVECGTDLLEDEALRRAKDGFDEPVFYQGEVVGHVRKYSDQLMIHRLNGVRKEKYATRQEQHITGSGLTVNIHKGTIPRGD